MIRYAFRPRPRRSRSSDRLGSRPLSSRMRVTTADEAVGAIRSGDQVYVHCAAAAPSVLLDALVARAGELSDVGMVHLHIEGPGPHLAREMEGHFRHRALFIGPNARAAVGDELEDLTLPQRQRDARF